MRVLGGTVRNVNGKISAFWFFASLFLLVSCSKPSSEPAQVSDDGLQVAQPLDTNDPTTVNFGSDAHVERTLTLNNPGTLPITNIFVSVPPLTPFQYKGGTYPGTGGTCSTSLAAGASCTIVLEMLDPYITGNFSYKTHLRYQQNVSTYRSLVLTLEGSGTRTCQPFSFNGGSGISNDPYLVSTVQQLWNVKCSMVPGRSYFQLANDIDLDGIGLFPIGTTNNAQNGQFNGAGHTISNYQFQRPNYDYAGLFGYTNLSIINLTITGFSVTGRDYVGAIAGYLVVSAGSITASSISVSGRNYIGGLFGLTSGSVTTASGSAITVSSSGSYAGGFSGVSVNGTISNLTMGSTVSGDYRIAGAIAMANNLTLDTATVTSTLTGSMQVAGGVVADASTSTLKKLTSTVTINGNIESAGGLVGVLSTSMMSRSKATINIPGSNGNRTGGAVGYLSASQLVNVYAGGVIYGNQYCGGLVGHATGSSSIASSYSTTEIHSTGNQRGGFVGEGESTNIVKSYWDTQTSLYNSSGHGNGGVGKTTAELKTPSTFTGWDQFSVWDIQNGSYPQFRSSAVTCVTGAGGFAGGAGTSGSPYQVSSIAHLYNINCNTNKYFILTQDIDASSENGFQGITAQFNGTFQGNNKTISNLTILSESASSTGLFYSMGTATVSDLTLSNATVVGGAYTGILTGIINNGALSNVTTSGTVSGTDYIGGIIGYATTPTATTLVTSAVVSGKNYVGGIVGTASNAIASSHSTGTVTAQTNYAGGIAGYMSSGSSLTSCYATGNISALNNYAGGLVGNAYGSTITGSYATGTVTAANQGSGGIVGYLDTSTLSNSYSTSTVNGYTYVGGLVGRTTTATLSKVYATGAVTASNFYGGGILGSNTGTSSVTNAFATGAISANGVGGIAGRDFGTLTLSKTLATGTVSGANSGGAIGMKSGSSVGSNCYWDGDTSGQATSGLCSVLTTAQAKDQSNFSGWDFSTIWQISSGAYPTLR